MQAIDSGALASLDLKCTLIGAGMRYPERVHAAVAGRARLEPPGNPFACNCVLLPGGVAVHLNANDSSPYTLDLDDSGEVGLYRDGERLCDVSFPPATDYYQQVTERGTPYGALAVLEGDAVLAFSICGPASMLRRTKPAPSASRCAPDRWASRSRAPCPMRWPRSSHGASRTRA